MIIQFNCILALWFPKMIRGKVTSHPQWRFLRPHLFWLVTSKIAKKENVDLPTYSYRLRDSPQMTSYFFIDCQTLPHFHCVCHTFSALGTFSLHLLQFPSFSNNFTTLATLSLPQCHSFTALGILYLRLHYFLSFRHNFTTFATLLLRLPHFHLPLPHFHLPLQHFLSFRDTCSAFVTLSHVFAHFLMIFQVLASFLPFRLWRIFLTFVKL